MIFDHHSQTGDWLKPGDRLVDWIVRHIGWVLTRWQCRADGTTAWQHIRGNEYTGEVLGFSEVCKHKLVRVGQLKLDSVWAKGIWVGSRRYRRRAHDPDARRYRHGQECAAGSR
jgi:hypothetical protein